VRSEGSGRLLLGSDCTPDGECATWKTIDSPMQNFGLYLRVMKWGHLQTDPAELDEGPGGDPNAPPVYHPALGPADWAKLAPELHHLLPGNGQAECFVNGEFVPACAEQEMLDTLDLVRGAGFVAGAADKDGSFGVDTVQYVNRILAVTRATDTTPATLATVPALVRDCWPYPEDPPSPPEEDPAPVDPPYDPPADCVIFPADPTIPNYELFAVASELFVDVSILDYDRETWRSQLIDVILPVEGSSELWRRTLDVSLLPWLEWRNGPDGATHMPGCVLAANDALRWIEFVHNYEIPADLFAADGAPPAMFRDGFETGDPTGWSGGQHGH
jgi:hypothetical protein